MFVCSIQWWAKRVSNLLWWSKCALHTQLKALVSLMNTRLWLTAISKAELPVLSSFSNCIYSAVLWPIDCQCLCCVYLCVGKLVPDNCTSGRSLPCTDVTEVVVVDLPPEHQQRYRISLSYHHKPAVHYPQVSTHYYTCTEQTHFACTAHHMYTWTHHTTCTQQRSYT